VDSSRRGLPHRTGSGRQGQNGGDPFRASHVPWANFGSRNCTHPVIFPFSLQTKALIQFGPSTALGRCSHGPCTAPARPKLRPWTAQAQAWSAVGRKLLRLAPIAVCLACPGVPRSLTANFQITTPAHTLRRSQIIALYIERINSELGQWQVIIPWHQIALRYTVPRWT
jgi:hypothetical protein